MALSFEELQQRLNAALLAAFGNDGNGMQRYWLCETFPDYMIARGYDGDLLQIPYTVAANDDVTLGEAQEVETAYVPVSEAVKFLATAQAAGGPDDGLTWPIQVMEAGFAHGHVETKDAREAALPHYFPVEAVAQVAEACKSARFGRRHPETDLEETDPSRIAGLIDGGRMDGNAARATLRLFPQEKDIQTKLMAAKEAGKLDLFGASILAYFAWKPEKVDGRMALVAKRLGRLVSVDFVTDAGAGGKILPYAASRSMLPEIAELQKKALAPKKKAPSAEEVQAAIDAAAAAETARVTEAARVAAEAANAAEVARVAEAAKDAAAKKSSSGDRGKSGPAQAGRNLGAPMKERILKVLETLGKFDAGRADELKKELEGLEEDKHNEFLTRVTEALNAVQQDVDNKGRKVVSELELKLAKITLDETLIEAKLPATAAKLVREHLCALGRAWTDDEAKNEIKRVREAFASYAGVGRVTSEGAIRVGRDTTEKVQVAFDKLFGVKEALTDKTVKPFRGLRDAFQEVTGCMDHADFFNGGFYRVKETVLTTDFPNLLKNSMTKRLIQDYEEYGMSGIDQLITETDVNDFKTQDRVRVGYYGNLPVVNENAAYAEMTKPTDEIINYAVAKRGGFQDVTWETIVNDDLGKVTSFAPRLARSARQTLKQFITDFFVNNPNFDPDSVAWFHATHANLGSVALSSNELDARSIALFKQTEKDSAKRLGLKLDWIMVPGDLYPTAHQINTNQSGTNNWAGRFGANDERIIVNEQMTDVNDWVGGSLPTRAPFLEIAYLQGFRTPQIFIVPVEQRRAITAIDKIQLYGIYVFGGDIVDFRPVFKNVV